MNKRTKESFLKMLRKECDRLGKVRDSLRDLKDEMDMQMDNADEAQASLEECIDKLSELN
jgi:hypothetical protein